MKSVDHSFPLDKRKGAHAQAFCSVDSGTCEASLELTLMASPIVDTPARVFRVPCSLLDYTQPIALHIETPTCDSSHLFDKNWVLSKVPALVLILSSMTPTTQIDLARTVVAAAAAVDLVSHIQQVSRATDISVHSAHSRQHLVSIVDASLVVAASRAMKVRRLEQHMRHNWWVVSEANYSGPC